MTQDQFKADIETFEKTIFILRQFPETIQDEWNIERDYQTAVFIPFMHHLMRNDAEILTFLKFQTLSSETKNLLKKAEIIKNILVKAADMIGKPENGSDPGVANLIDKVSPFLNKESGTANNLHKECQKILSDYSKSRFSTIKRHARSLSMALTPFKKLTSDMKSENYPSEGFKKMANALENAMDNVSAQATVLQKRIEEIGKQLDNNVDSFLKFKETSQKTGEKRTVFITHLFTQFHAYILDDKRTGNKDECYKLYDILIRDPSLEELLKQVYEVGRPNRFSHIPTTDKNYEMFSHDTAVPSPSNVLQFEEKIREKKWHCYKNEDENVPTFIKDYIKSSQEDGYKVNYIYLSPDSKLTFTCKSKGRRYFFELTFRDAPSSIKRSLQEKKVMGDYLWRGNCTPQQETAVDASFFFNKDIADAVAMYGKYGIRLSQDFHRDQLAAILTKRLRADAFMPMIIKYLENLTSDFDILFKFLTIHEDEGPDYIQKSLMEAMGNYPEITAKKCDLSLLDWEKLRPEITKKIEEDIKTSLDRYAFMTDEEKKLREDIIANQQTTAGNVLKTLDFDSLKTSFLQDLASRTSDFIMSALKESKASSLEDYKKQLGEIKLKSDALLNKIMPTASIQDPIGKILAHDNTLDKEKTLLLDAVLLRSHLKSALHAQPEKLLEHYDFLSPMDDWRKKTARNIMWMILGAYTIDQIIDKNENVLKSVLLDNEEFRRKIEHTIRKNWAVSEEEKDLTPIIMAITNFMTKGKLDQLYSIRRGFVNPDSEYFPVPLLFYEEKAPKRWKEYNEDDHTLADAFAEHAETFLRRTKKFSDQRTRLYELLNDEQKRIEYLWGDGTKYDEMIEDALSEIRRAGYRIPKDMDLVSVRQELQNFLCNDTKSFLSDYDFSDELDGWGKQRVRYFVEGYPRIQSLLSDGYNIEILTREYNVNLGVIHKKYAIYDDYHIDTQFSTTGVTLSRGEQTLTEKDHNQEFSEQVFKDDWKILKNYRYGSSLKTYLMQSNVNQSKNILRNEIRKRNRINKKPTKKQQKELAKVGELRRRQEALKLLDILRAEHMRSVYSSGSDEKIYLLKLLIYEMEYAKEMDKKEIIVALVNDHHYDDEYIKKNYDKLKQRSKELIENAQKKNSEILKKFLKKEKLSNIEKVIMEKYYSLSAR